MANIADTDIEQLIFFILQENFNEKFLFQIEPLKWHQIGQKLSNKSICSVIFFLLKKKNLLEILPQEVRDKWQRFYNDNLKRNTLALEQAVEIQNALGETGIRFILLKGISLVSTVYNNLGLRSFVDIDLLVKKEDLPALKNKLENLNYKLQCPKKALLSERFGCAEWIFVREGFIPLDVRWQLCQYERFKGIIKFNERQIFQDAAHFKMNNNQLLSLSKEDLFLYLSMHFALVHKFSGFSWFYDLKAVIDYYGRDFDWGLLINKARKANLTTVLYYVLYFYKKFLDTDFPSEILRRMKPSFIKRKLISSFMGQRNILSFIFSPKIGKRYYIGQVFLMDGLFNIIRVSLKMLFPSKEWLLYRYSKDSYRLQHIFQIIKW